MSLACHHPFHQKPGNFAQHTPHPQPGCITRQTYKKAARDSVQLKAGQQDTMITTTVSKGTFLGKEHVPLLGIGLAALGRPGYINLGHNSDLRSKSVEDMRQACWQVLDAAYAAGVRYFDAARSYGRAEEFLSGWLQSRGIAPGEVLVGSKWGYYYTADWQIDTGGKPHEVKEHTLPNLKKQTLETQGWLGSHLNLYQIHSATLDSGVLDAKDVLLELELMKLGLGWQLGLSLSGVQQADTLRKAMSVTMSDGRMLFDSVQATWNLLEQSAGEALSEAHAAGMSVIIKEGMANGRLTERNAAPAFQHKLSALSQMAKKYHTTVDALALACIMAQPFKPMVLSGAAVTAHIQSNACAMELADRLQPTDLHELLQQMKQDPVEYWKERSALEWN